jgi:hypothetical protein
MQLGSSGVELSVPHNKCREKDSLMCSKKKSSGTQLTKRGIIHAKRLTLLTRIHFKKRLCVKEDEVALNSHHDAQLLSGDARDAECMFCACLFS